MKGIYRNNNVLLRSNHELKEPYGREENKKSINERSEDIEVLSAE
jgi:hypothetical protein